MLRSMGPVRIPVAVDGEMEKTVNDLDCFDAPELCGLHEPNGFRNGRRAQGADIADDTGDSGRIAELAEKLKRQAADLDNARKRLERESGKQRERDRNLDLLEWLNLVDSIERALQAAPPEDSPWRQGFDAVRRQAQSILSGLEVEPVGTRGESFDPRLHEAEGATSAPLAPEGAIARVNQIGYRRGGQLLRPAKVIIVKNSSAEGSVA
jgi:molecular chaperone GrpE